MATNVRKTKKTVKIVRGRKPVARQGAGDRLRRTWDNTVEAITAAESDLERQVKALLKRNRISTTDAKAMFQDLSALIGRERKKALREFETRLTAIQTRARKQRKAVGQAVDEALQTALASFNIPSRQEVRELTRKVDELSRRVGGLRPAPRRAAARKRR
jgi:polyhydroxyalkanoate synthesis regulator phasin